MAYSLRSKGFTGNRTMRLSITQLDLRGKRVFLPANLNFPLSGDTITDDVRVPMALAGFDIGPATVIRFRDALRDAGTVVWNGPMGLVEQPPFASGAAFLEALEGRELPGVAALSDMTGHSLAEAA